MYQNLLRLYTIICLWAIRLQLWAQEEGRDDLPLGRRGDDGEMLYSEEMLDYQPFHIRFSDIMMFAAFMYFYMR